MRLGREGARSGEVSPPTHKNQMRHRGGKESSRKFERLHGRSYASGTPCLTVPYVPSSSTSPAATGCCVPDSPSALHTDPAVTAHLARQLARGGTITFLL